MSAQSQVYDQIYQQRSSEFINRQRIANEQYAKRQEKDQSKRIKAIRAIISQANDTQRKVRLHHPSTRRQIGEAVRVHYKSDSILMFELVNHPGKMLRVNPTGKVEFAAVHDETAVFELEAMYSGNLYFLCTAYREHDNIAGTKGWYLSMSERGQLTGNGGKGDESQWMMLTEQPPQPNGVVEADGTAAAESSNAAGAERSVLASETNPIMSQAQGAAAVLANSSTHSGIGLNDAGSDGTFPGVGAGREALMKYFLSKSGVKFLQQPEYKAAYALYVNNGVLAKILHRPDWPLVANRFVDYTTLPTPPLRKSIVDSYLSYAELKSYFEHGYVVGRSVIPPESGAAALKVVNHWVSKHMHTLYDQHMAQNNAASGAFSESANNGTANVAPHKQQYTDGLVKGPNNSFELTGSIVSDIDILALYYATPAVQIVQRLLGAGDVANPLSARIITTFPTLELVDSPALFGNKWSIEGFTGTGGHSPYTILLGVALTDIPESSNGNFCVHAGSHMILLEEYQAQVQRKSTSFTEDPNVVSKLDLGEPTQLLLRAGDVFLCSQRCATLQSTNAGPLPTTIVYFRLSHVDHGYLKTNALESLWVEYKSASYYLESTDEASAEQAQAVIDARVRAQQQASTAAAKAAALRNKIVASAPTAPTAAVPSTAAPKTATTAGAGAAGAKKGAVSTTNPVADATKKVIKPPAKPAKNATPANTEGRAKPITAKQSHILMDLLDVRRKDDDLWGDAPLPPRASSITKSAATSANTSATASANASVTTSASSSATNSNTPTSESKVSDVTTSTSPVAAAATAVPAAHAPAPSTAVPAAVSVANVTAQAEPSLTSESDTYNPISVYTQEASSVVESTAMAAAVSVEAFPEVPTRPVVVHAVAEDVSGDAEESVEVIC